MKKLLATPNGIQEIDLTAEEIAQVEKDKIESIAIKQARETERQAKEANKASALAKLTALGLTEEEVKSIL
jgi:hypothetical protein